MSLVTVGQVLRMNKVHVPQSALPKYSDFGCYYELDVQVNRDIGTDEAVALTQAIIDQLEPLTAHVKSVQVNRRNVIIQIQGSPFVWESILTALITLFPWFALGVVLIAIYFLITSVPGWVWGLLFVGAAAWIIVPIVMPAFTSTTKQMQKAFAPPPAKKKKK